MIGGESNALRISANLKRIPVELRAQVRAALLRITSTVQRYLVNEKLTEAGPSALGRRTGNTARAVFSRVTGPDSNPVGEIGIDLTKAPGARINDRGGTILPKRAKSLTIPLAAALTGNKVARFSAKQVIGDPQAFGYRGTFTAKGIIFGILPGVNRDQSTRVPLFALAKSVVIPAKHFMQSTLDVQTPWILAQLNAALKQAVDGTGGPANA